MDRGIQITKYRASRPAGGVTAEGAALDLGYCVNGTDDSTTFGSGRVADYKAVFDQMRDEFLAAVEDETAAGAIRISCYIVADGTVLNRCAGIGTD